jgi:cytochrome P450
MTAGDYHYVSHWRVRGTVDEVTAVFNEPRELPRWWPAVYLEVNVLDPGDENQLGYTCECVSKGFLPYTIRWRSTTTEVRRPYGFTIAADGDFIGGGDWRFTQDGDWVDMVYDWRVGVGKRLLRYGAFALRPLYEMNHCWAMRKGEQSLQLELDRRRAATTQARAAIPAPPGPVPRWPFVAVTIATLGAGGLIGRGVRQLLAGSAEAADRARPTLSRALGRVGLLGLGAGLAWVAGRALARRATVSPADVPGRRRAPSVGGYPVVGALPQLQQDPLRFLTEAARTYGDVVRIPVGPLSIYLLSHPEHARRVLEDNLGNYARGRAFRRSSELLGSNVFNLEGAAWQRQRRLLEPVFDHGHVQSYADVITGATIEMLDRWDVARRVGHTLDIEAELRQLSARIAIEVVFGPPVREEVAPFSEALIRAASIFDTRIVSMLPIPLSVPTPANRRAVQLRQALDTRVYRHIQAARAHPPDGPTLLGALLGARHADTSAGMTDKQLRDEITMTVTAGYVQPALVLAWTGALLAQSPVVTARLRDELAAVLGGRAPTATDLPKLAYASMVVQEALRLYPPTWAIARSALAADELSGIEVPAGADVILSVYGLHRHPDFWEDPERFDPERFQSARAAARPPYAYLPFSGGPHSCLGADYAPMVMTLVLAQIVQRFDLHLLPGQDLRPVGGAQLRPRNGLLVTLEEVS